MMNFNYFQNKQVKKFSKQLNIKYWSLIKKLGWIYRFESFSFRNDNYYIG